MPWLSKKEFLNLFQTWLDHYIARLEASLAGLRKRKAANDCRAFSASGGGFAPRTRRSRPRPQVDPRSTAPVFPKVSTNFDLWLSESVVHLTLASLFPRLQLTDQMPPGRMHSGATTWLVMNERTVLLRHNYTA